MSPIRMARLESASRAALAFQEAFNRHDIVAMTQLMHNDCVFETFAPAPDGSICTGRAAIAAYWQDFFRRSPQARLTAEEVFGFGDRCLMRWRCDWLDGDGTARHLRGIDVIRMRDDLIGEVLSYVKG